jgi:hypothetical protein
VQLQTTRVWTKSVCPMAPILTEMGHFNKIVVIGVLLLARLFSLLPFPYASSAARRLSPRHRSARPTPYRGLRAHYSRALGRKPQALCSRLLRRLKAKALILKTPNNLVSKALRALTVSGLMQRFARNPPHILKQTSIQLLPDRLSWDLTHFIPPRIVMHIIASCIALGECLGVISTSAWGFDPNLFGH